MLLVDDDEAEVRDFNRLLEQGVGPHHQPRLARCQRGAAAARLGGGAGQQDHRVALPQQPRQAREVLLGEQFGGSHEGALVAALQRRHQRQGRHDGLAAPHVPLEQAEHRVRAGEVVQDLHHYPFLRRGEPEGWNRRQGLPERRAEPVGPRPRRRLLPPPPERQGHLQIQQLAVDQPQMRRAPPLVQRLDVGVASRMVERLERLAQRRQAVATEELRGDRLRDLSREIDVLEHAVQQPAQRRRPHLAGGRIDGGDPVAMDGARRRLAGGVHQLDAVPHRFHRTVEKVLLPTCLIHQIRAVEPDDRQPPGAVLDEAADQREAPPAGRDAAQPHQPPRKVAAAPATASAAGVVPRRSS